MATKDFRASQVETSKIIASGNLAAGKQLGLVIYSGSVASNREGGVTDAQMLSNVGTDVFLFVSGAISHGNVAGVSNRDQVSLFGGDVVISGTLYAERQVIEVDSVADGDFFVTGNMYVEPDSDSTTSVAFRNAAGTTIFSVDSTNKRVGINNATPGGVLAVTGASDAGSTSFNVRHADTDEVGVDLTLLSSTANAVNISASSTTAKAVFVSANSLTTGNALQVQDASTSTSNRHTVEITQVRSSAVNATALVVSASSNGSVPGIAIDRNHAATTTSSKAVPV